MILIYDYVFSMIDRVPDCTSTSGVRTWGVKVCFLGANGDDPCLGALDIESRSASINPRRMSRPYVLLQDLPEDQGQNSILFIKQFSAGRGIAYRHVSMRELSFAAKPAALTKLQKRS